MRLARGFLKQAVNLAADGGQIDQPQEDDGIPDVGNLVEVAQAADDHLPNRAAEHLPDVLGPQPGLDNCNEAVDSRLGDRALGAGNQDAAPEFVPVERLPASGGGSRCILDHKRQLGADALDCREAALTRLAQPSPPDLITV